MFMNSSSSLVLEAFPTISLCQSEQTKSNNQQQIKKKDLTGSKKYTMFYQHGPDMTQTQWGSFWALI